MASSAGSAQQPEPQLPGITIQTKYEPEVDTCQRLFIFVIGAGKRTLSMRLAEKYGFVHFSVGDVLRQNTGDPVICEYVEEKKLLPSGHLFEIFNNTFKAFPHELPIIVDGFPRCLEQAREFEKIFGEPKLVLFLHCPRNIVKSRVVGRQDGRLGETEEVFDKQYNEYREFNPAILDYYGHLRGTNKLVEVNTSEEKEAFWDKLVQSLGMTPEWNRLLLSFVAQKSTGFWES
ncbi:hypothetical protein N0V88_003244 [Collariella sp. IMI 366227]|nr:hypothetical protein N0V88_003244 [Collariella sp. IMI 366227]